MKLIFAIVSKDDSYDVQDALTQEAETEAPDLEQITDGADVQP